MNTIHVDIVSAEGEIFSGEARMVFLPASEGEIGVTPRHAPLLTLLKPGEVRVQPPEGEEQYFYVGGGALEVQPTKVTVLADTAVRAKDLDEAAAVAARQRAEQALADINLMFRLDDGLKDGEQVFVSTAAGAVVSFDLNFREKLWKACGGVDRAEAVLRRIAQHVDVLVGVPSVDDAVKTYPQIKIVATTLRQVHSANRHSWSAQAWINGQAYRAPTCELDVYDRVGGGDGFAAGFFYGLLAGETPEDALRLGWAHGALLATFPGDTTMAKLADVRALAQGGSARIQR